MKFKGQCWQRLTIYAKSWLRAIPRKPHPLSTHMTITSRLLSHTVGRVFQDARNEVLPMPKSGLPASLHECRSLSERLYRTQGVNTMILLGHKHQAMTDLYNDDSGLTAGQWKTLSIA